MSDAKAKAEARRAKILAREKNKVSAVSTIEDEDLLLALADAKAKERPLAARRSLVESTLKVEGEDNITNPENTSNIHSKKDEDESTKKETVVSDSSTTITESESAKEKRIKFPPAKTLEEIEREVAENTAKFDEKTLGKKIENEDSSSKKEKKNEDKKVSKIEDTAMKKKDDQETTSEKAVKKTIKVKVGSYSIDPSTATRILRLLLIVAVASWTGYRVVQRHHSEVFQAIQKQNLDEFDLSNQFQEQQVITTSDRTWIQYFQYRVNSQIEAPVSAILLVYWVSKMFTPAINTVFKVPKQKSGNLFQMAFEFLNTGVSVWLEKVYTVLGELSLHFFVLVLSVVLWTIYYADQVNKLEENQTTPVALTTNTEL